MFMSYEVGDAEDGKRTDSQIVETEAILPHVSSALTLLFSNLTCHSLDFTWVRADADIFTILDGCRRKTQTSTHNNNNN